MARRQSNSRAVRYGRAVDRFDGAKGDLESKLEDLKTDAQNGDPVEEVAKKVEDAIGDFTSERDSAAGDVSELYDEIDSWKSNMEGTNLENTSKYEQLGECADELDNAKTEMEDADPSLSFDADAKSDGTPKREVLVDAIDELISEVEGYEVSASPDFPGMFG